MATRSLTRKRLVYWSPVIVLTVAIYSTLYVARLILNFMRENLPMGLVVDSVIYLVLALVIAIVAWQVRFKKASTLCALAAVATLYGVGFQQAVAVEEKIHFIEYGVLAVLIYRAARLDFENWWSHGIAFFLTAAIGWGDEGIQYLLPNRVYDLRDVAFNAYSGFLALILLAVYTWDQPGNR